MGKGSFLGRVPAVALLLVLASVASPLFAGVVVYEEGNKKIEVGARVQLQYMATDPDGGASTDDLFFRRLRPYIQGTVTENWFAKIQFDLGKAEDDNEVAVKDAYMRYTGFENFSLTLGNQKPPFSREFLTSSKRQQLIERSFVGDHNYGAPDRFLGLRLDGHNDSKKMGYSVAVGSERVDPDVNKLDFDSPANDASDWNEGILFAGRVDFHPNGKMAFDQGDFDREGFKYTVSLAAFSWSNDDDNNTYTDAAGMATSATKADVDSSTGYELSVGVRGGGFSADAEYHMLETDTVDNAFTGGIFVNGTTDLDVIALEGGYMLPSSKVELVVGWDSLDSDGYQDAWTRTSAGLNWFWNKHKAKAQLTYRQNENVNGVMNVDSDELFAQAQFVF